MVGSASGHIIYNQAYHVGPGPLPQCLPGGEDNHGSAVQLLPNRQRRSAARVAQVYSKGLSPSYNCTWPMSVHEGVLASCSVFDLI